MATITKRKNQNHSISFVAQVRVQPFKPVAKSFSDRQAAVGWATAMEASLRRDRDGGAVRPDLPTLTIADLAREYLADSATQALKSYRSTEERVAWWVNDLGAERVREFGTLKLRAARERLQPGRAPATVNRYLAAMRSCWNWGRAAGLVPEDRRWPTRLMLPEPKGRTRYLTDAELSELLSASKAVSPNLHAAIVVALATGVRRGELLRLTWADVDLAQQTARVLEAKNGAPRSVHLPSVAVDALTTAKRGPVVGRNILSHPNGDPIRDGELEVLWRKVRSAAKLVNFRWHDLRHSCASFLAQNGATLLEIGAVLGHKSPSVTARYAHLIAGSAVTGHDKLNEKLGGAGQTC